jgi:hypothetical protein
MAELKKGNSDPGWGALICGPLLLGFAVWMYYDLTAFEAAGGERRMQWILVLAYKLLGKWGVVGFFALAGAGSLLLGISQIAARLTGGAKDAPARRKKEWAEPDDEDE